MDGKAKPENIRSPNNDLNKKIIRLLQQDRRIAYNEIAMLQQDRRMAYNEIAKFPDVSKGTILISRTGN